MQRPFTGFTPYEGYEDMRVEKQNGVVIATLNVPEKLNPLTPGIRLGLKRIIEDVRWDDEAKVLVITGTGRGFCSGADMSGTGANPYAPTGRRTDLMEPRYKWAADFTSLDKPTIAAVNGVAAGGGLAVALMCDMRIVAESARFISVFVRRALIPDSGTTWLLPRIVGVPKALRMILTGEDVSAQEAYRIGLADEVVPDDQLMDKAMDLAQKIASGPSVTIELSKRAVYRGLDRGLLAQGEYEEYAQRIVQGTEDVEEGRLSFREKRPPEWKGK